MAIVKIEHLSKSYHNINVFTDFNLEIKSGEFVMIAGKSGSGKSTLCNMIGLLDKPDNGKIYIDDELIDYKTKQVTNILKNKISYLFQNFALIDNKTVGYNMEILYPSKKDRKNKRKLIEKQLTKVGLSDCYDKYVYECSGGQQQRIAIARLLLKPGEIIICDEPTGSLDEENKQIVMDLLVELNQSGKTIIMVSHDQTLFNYANRVINI